MIENEEDNNIKISHIPRVEVDVNEDNANVIENEIKLSTNEEEIDDNDDDEDDENENENDKDDNNEENNEIFDQNILKTCGDGYELDVTNRCVDIDECTIGNAGCQFCKNVNGGVCINIKAKFKAV